MKYKISRKSEKNNSALSEKNDIVNFAQSSNSTKADITLITETVDVGQSDNCISDNNALIGYSASQKKKTGKKLIRIIKRLGIAVGLVALSIILALVLILNALFNGPSKTARNMAVKSLDETSAMKWLSRLFLPADVVDEILGNTQKADTDSETTINDTEDPFIFDFDDKKERLITLTLDIGQSITMKLSSDLTVKSCELSDSIEGFSSGDEEGKKLEAVVLSFLSALDKTGIIVDGVNDALLIGSISDSFDISDNINNIISDIISKNDIPITVLFLYSASEDAGIAQMAVRLGMSYNKVRLCNMIADGNASIFYKLSFMNLCELIAYCEDNQIDIASLVDSANIKEKQENPPITEQPYDEWEDCPDGIKIIRITGKTYRATLLLIKDPSKVYAGTSLELRGISQYNHNVAGVQVLAAAKNDGAIAAINGGFYYDGNYKYNGMTLYNGSMPFGSVVSKGKFVYENDGGPYKGFIGFTNDNVLVAFNRSITKEDYEKYSIRDGMSCAPALIINGIPQSYSGAEDEKSLNPRTAIGQRADGAVIFLTIDGRMGSSLGGSYSDIIDIMLEYGAVTAGNLDGGSSSVMYYLDSRGLYGKKGEYVMMNTRSQISSPRYAPTFFMVKP